MGRRKDKKKKGNPAIGIVHEEIVRSLEEKLNKDDRTILTNFQYRSYLTQGDHEADILVIDDKGRYAYAIEVKTTNHYRARRKASKQLKADKEYLNHEYNIHRVYCFYAYSSKGRLYDIEWKKKT